MNYIYDIVLNFTDINNFLEFYEWKKTDKFTYIEKIPIYVVNDISLIEIYDNLIKIDNYLLEKICDKTYTNNGKIKYSLLVTDRMRVIALRFNDNGIVEESSSLLMDEEDAVTDEISNTNLDIFNYKIIKPISNDAFLTRYEKDIKNSLLDEINYLYNSKIYDELNYLYFEVYDEELSIKEKYNKLLDIINNNIFDKMNYLYEIIKLTKEKSY